MAQRLAGYLSVDESAKRIRHYRYAEERMMRVMGGWIALTPELSAKLLLGRQVWDCAQHADLWARRLPELRSGDQGSEPANDTFGRFMDLLESREEFGQTPERLVGIYRVLKPHLLAVYEHHLAHANAVYEPPTRRILQRTIEDERRHIAAGRAILTHHLQRAGVHRRADAWQGRLEALLVETGGVTGEGIAHLVAPEISSEGDGVAGDLIELEKPAGRWPLAPDLEAAVEAHARNLERRDLAAAGEDLSSDIWAAGTELYRTLLAQGPDRHEVVGVAKLGAHRLVKLRLDGPNGAVILASRWAQREGRWRVAEVEVVRIEGSNPP